MSIYANPIHQSALFKRFDRLPKGMDEITEAEVDELKGYVLQIAKQVGPQMAEVGKTFRQYTDHSLTHLCNIADIIHRFLPESKMSKKACIGLNALELTILWAGILLHDVGMFVTESEKEADLKSDNYRRFKQRSKDRVEAAERARKSGLHRRAQEIEDALVAEFYRRGHAKRSNQYVLKHLTGRFFFREVDLAEVIGKVAESHNWRVFRRDGGLSSDPVLEDLKVKDLFHSVPANLQYIACCLRMGDIMDFDRSRTPLVIFETMGFTEEVSKSEWNKHRSIKGWDIGWQVVDYIAECEQPEYYVAVQEFLGWVDAELDAFSRIVAGFKGTTAIRYPMPLPNRVNRDAVGMKNSKHLAGAFKYQLEFDEIMQLLMDKSLYPDPALFLRELLQNSLDACRYQKALATKVGMEDKYVPRIDVWDYSNDPDQPRIVFRDNGYGMDIRTIEQYFLRVGKSYYRSPDFIMERELLAEQGIFLDSCSRFGIGFLSCFLAGNNIEVETYRLGAETPLKVRITGPSRYFLIEKLESKHHPTAFLSPSDRFLDGPPNYPGTKITVHLKPGWREGFKATDRGVVYDTINTYAVATEFPIMVHWSTLGIPLEVVGDEFSKTRFPAEADAENPSASQHPLEDLLSLVEIPLPVGNDSLRFNGRIWALMVKDGTQTGGRNHNGIQIGVEVGAHPYSLQYISVGIQSKVADLILEFIQIARKVATKGGRNTMGLLGVYLEHIANRFFTLWHDLSPEDRSSAREIIGSPPLIVDSGGTRNFDLARLVKAIIENNYAEVVRLRVEDKHDYIYDFSFGNQSLALHGILIPSQILNFKPLEGYAVKNSFLPEEIFAQVNLSGLNTPVPSASRLYFAPENARDATFLLNQAVLRWAINGLEEHPNDDGWAEFFSRILSHCTYGCPEVVLSMLEQLLDKIEVYCHSPSEASLEDSTENKSDWESSLPNLQVLEDFMDLMDGEFGDISSEAPEGKPIQVLVNALMALMPNSQDPQSEQLGQMIRDAFGEQNDEGTRLKSLVAIYDYLSGRAEQRNFESNNRSSLHPTHASLRELLLTHKAIVPIYPRDSSIPIKTTSYVDLDIFHEAPIVLSDDGQRYRDLREWVKKYLPTFKIEG